MKIQTISMSSASNKTYNPGNNSRNFNGGNTYVIVPADLQEDSFGKWAAKNVATASIFSVAWDLGRNVLSKMNKNIEAVPTKEIFKNVPKVAGVFFLIAGIFKVVSNAIDKM